MKQLKHCAVPCDAKHSINSSQFTFNFPFLKELKTTMCNNRDNYNDTKHNIQENENKLF